MGFIDSFDWDSLLPEPKPKAVRTEKAAGRVVVVEGRKLSIEAERERQARHARELIEREKRRVWEEAARHNREWIEELRSVGEYHASQKRVHMEAECWAREQGRRQRHSETYDPVRRWDAEVEPFHRDK